MTPESAPPDDAIGVLGRAGAVLAPFFEAAFRAELRRLRGAGEGVAPEPPRALQAFGRFTPAKAVAQAGVRTALVALLHDDPELWPLVADEIASPAPDPDAVIAAATAGDLRALEAAASAAAAHRLPDPGWEAIVFAALAATTALAAGSTASSDAAGAGRGAVSQKKADRVAQEKLAHRLERAEAARRSAETELAALKDRQATLRRKLDAAQAALAAANERADVAAADAAQAVDGLAEARRQLEQARVARRRAEREAQEVRAALQGELAALHAARIPDLEPVASELERLARTLRTAASDVHSAAATFDEMKLDAIAAATVRSAPVTPPAGADRNPAPPRRVPVPYPPGVLAGTADAARAVVSDRRLLVVIDGYNVIRQRERGWGELAGHAGRDLLVARCASARGAEGALLRIVFDASEPDSTIGRRQPAGVHVEFSGGPIADDRIVAIVAAQPPEQPVVVVTSDRELTDRVAEHGADTVRSDVFLAALGAPAR